MFSNGLERLDNRQTGAAPWLFVAAIGVGDLFCIFDHSAPWAKVLFAGTMALLSASVLLHGAWRLKLTLRSWAAASALMLGAFMFAFGPSMFPGIGGFLVLIISVAVGLTLWWNIIWRPSPTSLSAARAAGSDSSSAARARY